MQTSSYAAFFRMPDAPEQTFLGAGAAAMRSAYTGLPAPKP